MIHRAPVVIAEFDAPLVFRTLQVSVRGRFVKEGLRDAKRADLTAGMTPRATYLFKQRPGQTLTELDNHVTTENNHRFTCKV